MDPLEKRLKAMRLAEPSADLDRRIDETFATARRRAETGARGWWLPLAATAALACAAFVLLRPVQVPDSPGPETVPVYRVEAKGLMRDMLIGPSDNKSGLPPFVIGAGKP